VAAKIEEALVDVGRYHDGDDEFSEWSIGIGAPLSGTGGSVDGVTRTVPHEFGRAGDVDRLTEDERATYLQLRGFDPSRPWRAPDGTPGRLGRPAERRLRRRRW